MTSSIATTDCPELQQAVIDGMERAGVPKRYRDVKPAVVDLGGRPWAYISGGVGSGKTFLAAQMLCRHLIDGATSAGDGMLWFVPRARFVTASGYLAEVKRGFDGEGSASDIRRTSFLVLDDLGQEVPTQWAVAELFDLINFRYSEELPTVITSQFSRGAIARRLAQNGGEEQALAIASRLAEECEVFDLGTDDRRLR